MLRKIVMAALVAAAMSQVKTAEAAPIYWIPVAGTWQIKVANQNAFTLQIFLPTRTVGGKTAGTVLINGSPGRYIFNQTSARGGFSRPFEPAG